jgi:hypothetical protein
VVKSVVDSVEVDVCKINFYLEREGLSCSVAKVVPKRAIKRGKNSNFMDLMLDIKGDCSDIWKSIA